MTKNHKNRGLINDCWNTHGVWSNASVKCERLDEHIHCRNCPIFSNEGKRVLDRVAPVGYLKEWRKTLSDKSNEQNIDNKSVLIFRVGDEWFALPAGCLQEITEKRTIHRMPRNINSDISGVVNVGGEIRICYSLSSILGIKNSRKKDQEDVASVAGRFIVALLDNQYYVFWVDQVIGLHWYNNDEVFPVPATLECEGRNMLSGVITHNKNNVAVLDVGMFQRNLGGIML